MRDDTIYALASGGGAAGLAVFRISGVGAGQALTQMIGDDLPEPRRAMLRRLIDPVNGEEVDRGLVLWFPAPASFTGEDVVEIHGHGGRAMTARLARLLGEGLGLRQADPGEFSRRAFEHGKMDLTEAEGLADLVDAETEAQRRQAQRQMQGALGTLYEDWRQRLMGLSAHLEATIDFSDEDLPDDLWRTLRRDLTILETDIDQHLADGHRGERLREGLSIAIVGPPNAGKSSLLNTLAKREAAIVSAQAGTTRDVIEVHMDLDGFPVVMADTAGLRQAADEIEGEGVRRALARAREADLKVAVLDGVHWPEVDPQTAALVDKDSMVVVNKLDRGLPEAPLNWGDHRVFGLSVHTGAGLEDFLAALSEAVAARCGDGGGAPPLTRRRHREAIETCRHALERAGAEKDSELMAEHVRQAARALGTITGRVGVEDMLDLVFRDFCIGK
ncbi:tRNA uridine-5-carboxymethylaminomethyl(34) synthesis GTPase MnmE [Magnetospira sp. QH-2]|uniref:tRNA uridine-5-carboxymethylaminomethyl(34) synthesis GTPase MnmE n=1 Tax=Magnetospira sp. (strain QH-2) TaxID=1288970 RepID=UPI0003E81693|nr:tRNA uridine-5-carboxymethylaminomethyl(34) synthesis GTPase MnmE [Magnetospira sp. QH-2]CCQ75611.1 tRNA modification GTPase MnmE [Magnetospira sp. QH-2]